MCLFFKATPTEVPGARDGIWAAAVTYTTSVAMPDPNTLYQDGVQTQATVAFLTHCATAGTPQSVIF